MLIGTSKKSDKDFRHNINIYTEGTSLRAGDEGADVMRLKRANVGRPMVFDGGFRVRDSGCGN